MSEPRNRTLSVKVTAQMAQDLARVAAAQHRSVSDLLYLMIRRELYGEVGLLDASLAVPAVHSRGPSFTVAERAAVYESSGGKCAYCEAAITAFAFEVDHVVPVSKGGSRDPSNLVATCKPCNRTKRAMSADMFRARLARLKKTA